MFNPEDIVVVTGRYAPILGKVERVTPTQVIVNSQRYNRKTGRLIGGDAWYFGQINLATPEDITRLTAEAHHRKLVAQLTRVNWKAINTATLEQVVALIAKQM